MITYSQLNENQKAAVTDESKHIRIIAGAGSGKTRVLTMRIAYLIEQKGVKPYHILAITFTNKAAREMKTRINDMLGDNGTGCHISTIHSLCMRILAEDITALNYPKNFTVIDADDQRQILKEAYKEIGIDKKEYPYGGMLDYIANNKYMNVDPAKAMEFAYGEPKIVNRAKVYEYYDKRLHQLYALDFDDLILFTTRLFELFPAILEKWSSKFHYIHVDEFQDVDREQYKLIKLLSTVHDNVYVVGDPDQTIFTWRGADVNIIVHFDRDFENTKTIILNQNYRSTNNILSGANSLIKNNKARLDKELFSKNGDGSKIIHKTCMSETGEANYVVSQIMKLHGDGYNYKDMAVLYRANYLSREVEKVLIENRINYVIYGGLRFYERMEVKDILSYLRMITRADDLAFVRIINTPRRAIGPKTIDAIQAMAMEKGISMYEVIKQGLYPKNKETFDRFVRMVEKWREDMKNGDLELLLQEVLDDSGYRTMLEKDGETERLENIKSLLDDIKQYSQDYPDSSLDEYLQMIALYTDRASEETGDAVNLCTIHSAKGLEFDVVFVIGLSEGIFPSERTMAEGQKGLEEERRLAYVAYTRAKKLLYLTESNSFSYVIQSAKLPSRFIKEIDQDFIDNVDERKDSFRSSVFDEDIVIHDQKKEKPKDSIYRNGDSVIHKIYGEGVVIGNDGGVLQIAFAHPYGIKKILAGHPSIRKKGKDDYS
ncbi:MAG: UvrD-helicase domain-containing protein [Erysipelotrichaceae bacterium]|nr:UvrD-helicase domain-containing protein [Erysipelotrichaceae bacterium]MEE3424961.1 UvrD-helicase domain-containing protein [Erysipelotrichaceae bacterium]